MNWKHKACLQYLFSAIPYGEKANYIFQRYITKSLQTKQSKVNANAERSKKHILALQKHLTRPIEECIFYEFGVGWDLIGPLTFYSMGVEKQIIIDIQRLSRPELVQESIDKMKNVPELMRYPISLNQCGIQYIAPCDARNTGLETESIECITTYNVFEHIPPDDIKLILAECRRILNNDGLMSFKIDYQDHYYDFDKKISVYNFLQYSDSQWKKYNPDLHYQNRLRHKEYLKMFDEAGFEILEEYRTDGTEQDLEVISNLPIDSKFKNFDIEELAVRESRLILRKNQ